MIFFSSQVPLRFPNFAGHNRAFKSKAAVFNLYSFCGGFQRKILGNIVGKLSIPGCIEVPLNPALGSWVGCNCP